MGVNSEIKGFEVHFIMNIYTLCFSHKIKLQVFFNLIKFCCFDSEFRGT